MTQDSPAFAIKAQIQSLYQSFINVWHAGIKKLPLLVKGGSAIADQGLFAGSNFLINVLLARFMMPTEYGAFATAYAIFLLMGSLYIAVLIEPMLVFGAGKYAERWRRYLGVMMYGHWWLSLILSIVLIAIAYVFQQQNASVMAEAMVGLCIAQPFILMNWILRRAFYVNSKPQWAASGGAVYLLLMLGGTLGAAWLGILSSFTALVVIAFASLVTSIWFIFLLKPIHLRQKHDLTSLQQVFKDHFHYGKWSAPTMLLTWIPSNVYYTVLPLVVGLAGSGALKASMNLIMPILHANTAISVLLAPTFVRALKYGGKEKLVQRTRFGLSVFAATCTLYAVVLLLFGNQLISFLYDGRYNDVISFGILFVMGLIPLVNGIGEIISGALRAIGKLDYILWTHIISGAFTVTVSLSLLVMWGMSGAYVGLLLASSVAAGVAYILYQRGLSRLSHHRIDELHSFDSTEAAVAASMRAEFVQAQEDNQISDVVDTVGDYHKTPLNVLIVNRVITPENTDAGWFTVEKIASATNHQLWVVLGETQRSKVEIYTKKYNLSKHVQFVFFDFPQRHLIQSISMPLYEIIWQICAVLIAYFQHRKHQIDVIHQATLIPYWVPSLLSGLPIPTVVGPINDGLLGASNSKGTKELIISNYISRLFLRRAHKVYAANPKTFRILANLGLSKVALYDDAMFEVHPEDNNSSDVLLDATTIPFLTDYLKVDSASHTKPSIMDVQVAGAD